MITEEQLEKYRKQAKNLPPYIPGIPFSNPEMLSVFIRDENDVISGIFRNLIATIKALNERVTELENQ
jgi:hypothetical protein